MKVAVGYPARTLQRCTDCAKADERYWQMPDRSRLNGLALLSKPSTGKRHIPAATLTGPDRELSLRLKLPVPTLSPLFEAATPNGRAAGAARRSGGLPAPPSITSKISLSSHCGMSTRS